MPPRLCLSAIAMTVEAAVARFGKVDPASAAVSLGITIPLALIFSAGVLFLGWLYAPGQRAEITSTPFGRPDHNAPVFTSRQMRFQTQPGAEQGTSEPL